MNTGFLSLGVTLGIALKQGLAGLRIRRLQVQVLPDAPLSINAIKATSGVFIIFEFHLNQG